MQKIFIVEDDEQILTLLSKALTKWNFEIHSVSDFSKVSHEVLNSQCDLVLMDINLPHFNGYHWTTEIRKTSTIPIIFLSSESDNLNMVMAMNMGADDFVSKPFDLQVLVAKIQALLRRVYTFTKETSVYEFKNFNLDVEDATLTNGEEEISLTKNEVKILSLLFQNVGTNVKREEIMEKLWESEEFVDKNTLSVTMARLRKKLLSLDFLKYVHTIKGEGYMLGEEE